MHKGGEEHDGDEAADDDALGFAVGVEDDGRKCYYQQQRCQAQTRLGGGGQGQAGEGAGEGAARLLPKDNGGRTLVIAKLHVERGLGAIVGAGGGGDVEGDDFAGGQAVGIYPQFAAAADGLDVVGHL